jgi:hypothetical protein
MKYSYRKSAFDKEKSYELTQSGIKVVDHKGNESLTAYSDITEINPSFVSTKNNSFYQCKIKVSSGPELLFKSQHYKGLANFENRNEDYTAFIKGLHKIVNATNLNIKFKKGIGTIAYILSMVIFVITGLLFPITSVFLLIGGQIVYGGIGALVSVLLIFRMINFSKKNKPGSYSADALPDNLLPKEK